MAAQFIKEFREFAMKGNVLDLAVGVVIGTAFGRIVSSLVADIITPLMGLVTGKVDFKHLSFTVRAESGDAPAVVIQYGSFIQNVFDFLIIALSIFLMIRFLNAVRRRFERERKQEEAKTAPKSGEEKLLEEIRDLLKREKS